MGFDDCYQLGYIQKTHGLKGAVSILLDADYPEDYLEMESVLINQNGQLVPFFISSLSIQGSNGLMTLEDIDSLDAAKGLCGMELWLPLNNLPQLEEDQYYYHDLPGYEIVEDGRKIGVVENVYSMPNCDLLAMQYEGYEVLIPIQDEVVLNVEKATKTIFVKLPDGLIDIYTSTNEN